MQVSRLPRSNRKVNAQAVLALWMITQVVLAGCLESEQVIDRYHGEDINPEVPVADFTLWDENGELWNWQNASQDKAVIVVFLFTNCLDVCPVVSQNTLWILENLEPAELEQVTAVTITVDPWRDDMPTLRAWKDRMGATWSHVGIPDVENKSQMNALEAVWETFGVGLSIEAGTPASELDFGNDSTTNTSSNSSTNTSEQSDSQTNQTTSEDGGNDTNTTGRHHGIDYTVEHSTGTIFIGKDGMQKIWWGDEDWVLDLVLQDVQTLLSE